MLWVKVLPGDQTLGSRAGSSVPAAAAQAFSLDQKSRWIICPYTGKQGWIYGKANCHGGVWRKEDQKEESRRNGQLSQFLGSLQAGGRWSHALLYVGWGGVSLSPSTLSTVAKCSCTSLAEYDFPHISGCNIITFLLANWDLSPSPGTLQIKLFFCISLTWLLMVVWRFVIVRFRLLSSHLRAIVQTL